MSKPKKPTPLELLLADSSAPLEQRREFLKMLLNDPSPEAHAAVQSLFTTLCANSAQHLYEERARELGQVLKQIEDGPLRPAAFIELLPKNGFAALQAHVMLDDGSSAYSVVPDAKLGETLRRGERVLLDGRGKAVLHRIPGLPKTGEEAQFERCLDERRVELTVRGTERCVFLVSQDLADKLQTDQVRPGAALVVNTRQAMAYDALPPSDGLAHYKYLQRGPAPVLDIQAEIGSPPACIGELIEHARLELTEPERVRRYGVQRCVMRLFAGVSGSGKTLATQAVCSGIYQVISDVTGVPVVDLPPRTFRLRMSEVLNYLLGESDKQLQRFFQEIEQLAAEPYETPDGRRLQLPVIVVMEEIDGICRARGGHDSLFDRLLTTVLQWLDPTRPELRDKLIFFLGTTNEPDMVDRAFLRRIGMTIDRFTRLRENGFPAVLRKHLNKVPVARNHGATPDEARQNLVRDITIWLFSPNGADGGMFELTYAGSTTSVVRHRRDLLTGALVDRAVQEAAKAALREEIRGGESQGVTRELLVRAFDNQVRAIVDQLTQMNVRHYVDVPDGVHVATLRRMPRPAMLPQELQRT